MTFRRPSLTLHPSTLPIMQRAEEELGWRATRSLNQMCADHWRWTEGNPSGYLTDSGGVPA
jgi:hypothetical protein